MLIPPEQEQKIEDAQGEEPDEVPKSLPIEPQPEKAQTKKDKPPQIESKPRGGRERSRSPNPLSRGRDSGKRALPPKPETLEDRQEPSSSSRDPRMMSPEKYPPLPDEDMDFKESKRKFLKDDVPDCIKRTRVQEQTPTGLYMLKTVALSAVALEKTRVGWIRNR